MTQAELDSSSVGIEFGSTRIKAVLIDAAFNPVAQGAFDWENSLVDGVWTYSLDLVERGLQTAFAELKADVKNKFGLELRKAKSLGISAMMHGYLAFDKDDNLLVPFRTWRNTITAQASEKLTDLFNFPIPERWSVSHLYQAILNNEKHVPQIASINTLAGWVHFKLTGQKVLGIGDASGMFPVDMATKNYDKKFMAAFDSLVEGDKFNWKLEQILPRVEVAGKPAGTLTEAGAKFLDPTGAFEAGCLLAPPEGDAGTGMVATNSVTARTGNVSAGTSVFAMIVLEKPLKAAYKNQIDIVQTPDGSAVAMAHANNCTGEYDKWINIFGSAAKALGADFSKPQLYDTLLGLALKGDKNCGGLVPYNYISGESITGFASGRPLFVRAQNANFTLENFMRAQLFTALGALRAGMDILFEKEKVAIDSLTGHGGFFKTAGVGAKIMAAAMHTAVSSMKTAGEGGPWGMAILAAFAADNKGMSLSDYLNKEVFARAEITKTEPDAADVKGFDEFFANYKKGLAVERAAVENLE